MIIQCKRCGTKHVFDDKLIIEADLNFKCSRCNHVITATLDESMLPGIFTELGVYLQYDLLEKSRLLLNRVLECFPENEEALELYSILKAKYLADENL